MSPRAVAIPRQRKPPSRRTGKESSLLEACVEGLHLIGFQRYDNFPSFRKAVGHTDRYIVRGWPHESLYGTRGSKEALIVAPPSPGFISDPDGRVRIIVEAKCQNVAGSTDEKLPYIWEAFLASPVPNWIAVLDGNAWKSGRGKAAVEWLTTRAKDVPDRRMFVVVDRRGFLDLAKTNWSPS